MTPGMAEIWGQEKNALMGFISTPILVVSTQENLSKVKGRSNWSENNARTSKNREVILLEFE